MSYGTLQNALVLGGPADGYLVMHTYGAEPLQWSEPGQGVSPCNITEYNVHRVNVAVVSGDMRHPLDIISERMVSPERVAAYEAIRSAAMLGAAGWLEMHDALRAYDIATRAL